MCDYCHLDEIKSINDIPRCLFCSLKEFASDLMKENLSIKLFLKKDRVYYIILLIILVLIVKRIFESAVHKNQESNQTSWEEDCRWDS